MTQNISDNVNPNHSLQYQRLIPPVLYKNRIFFISNPKLFLVLYKIGKLKDFMDFSELQSYDETKTWLKSQNLLNEYFLENVSHYSVSCKIKCPSKIRFFAKSPLRNLSRYELN